MSHPEHGPAQPNPAPTRHGHGAEVHSPPPAEHGEHVAHVGPGGDAFHRDTSVHEGQ